MDSQYQMVIQLLWPFLKTRQKVDWNGLEAISKGAKLEGTLADDCDAAAGELPEDAATNGFEDDLPNGLEAKGEKLFKYGNDFKQGL